jgi:hypothetical protein
MLMMPVSLPFATIAPHRSHLRRIRTSSHLHSGDMVKNPDHDLLDFNFIAILHAGDAFRYLVRNNSVLRRSLVIQGLTPDYFD